MRRALALPDARPFLTASNLRVLEESAFWVAVYDYCKLLIVLIDEPTFSRGLESDSAEELSLSLLERIEEKWISDPFMAPEPLTFRQPLSVRILTMACLVLSVCKEKQWGNTPCLLAMTNLMTSF